MNNEIKKLGDEFSALVARFKEELALVRTNRPTPKLVEDIRVDYYNQPMTVKQLGSISVVPPREIDITVWDSGAVGMIAKGIEASNLGASVSFDKNIVRVNLPQLTNERRQELIKLVKSLTEKERIKIRVTRDEYKKKSKELPDEDARYDAQERIQKLVDGANENLEILLVAKVKEINE